MDTYKRVVVPLSFEGSETDQNTKTHIEHLISNAIVIRNVNDCTLTHNISRGLNILGGYYGADCILYQDLPIEVVYYYENTDFCPNRKGGYAVDAVCNLRNADGSPVETIETTTGLQLSSVTYFAFTAGNNFGIPKRGYLVDALLFHPRHRHLIENKIF